jgi:3-dehydroquinate dehydratase II
MIYVLNGPNLNLLGTREIEIYGRQSLSEMNEWIQKQRDQCPLRFLQSNSEGQLIDSLQEANEMARGVVLNAGGYSHTSVAIHDCIRAIRIPVVEVHISNIHARESFRRETLTGRAAAAVISGMGAQGYLAAIDHLMALYFEGAGEHMGTVN